MFPTSHILPDALGIEWGMSRELCLAQPNIVPLKQTSSYVTIRLLIQEKPYEVDLRFDDHRNLERIEVYLYVSRGFWEDFTYDEIEQIAGEYLGHYDRVVEYISSILGFPDFSGDSGMDGYPTGLGAGSITYWNRPEGRIQVEFDHPDKEFPMFVKVASYPV